MIRVASGVRLWRRFRFPERLRRLGEASGAGSIARWSVSTGGPILLGTNRGVSLDLRTLQQESPGREQQQQYRGNAVHIVVRE
jgi:hypothetical protein